jgi:hypothetical protein
VATLRATQTATMYATMKRALSIVAGAAKSRVGFNI